MKGISAGLKSLMKEKFKKFSNLITVISVFSLLITTINYPLNIAGATATLTQTSFTDDFNTPMVLRKAWPDTASASPYWWVNSGGYMYVENGTGRTIFGEVDPKSDSAYSNYTTGETDYGIHPQNIFRLVQRQKWLNYQQTAYFNIDRYILSTDSHRAASNGLLFFNRHYDENNLYYAGLRVDGVAIIKKKINSTYYTVASKKVLSGTYNRDTNPNLIPLHKWIGVRTEVKNVSSGVNVKLFLDIGRTGQWTLATEFTDDGSKYQQPFVNAANAGIRTDFMDVYFDDYKIIDLSAVSTEPAPAPVVEPAPAPEPTPVVEPAPAPEPTPVVEPTPEPAPEPAPVVEPAPEPVVDPVTSTQPALFSKDFVDNFNTSGTIEQTSRIKWSKSPDWWLVSGAYFNKNSGLGSTVKGNLPSGSKWQKYYASNADTDGGYHPQNIFKMVTRRKFVNVGQETYFKVNKDNLSTSPNRNQSNGVSLLSRYRDSGSNLYYAALRVDGNVVIKKKKSGVYYTMASKKILDGQYNRDTNPSLIPKNTWIGLRSIVKNNSDGTVSVALYMDFNRTGNWQLVLEAKDNNSSFGGQSILYEGYGGLQSSFMDVEFDDYAIGKSL